VPPQQDRYRSGERTLPTAAGHRSCCLRPEAMNFVPVRRVSGRRVGLATNLRCAEPEPVWSGLRWCQGTETQRDSEPIPPVRSGLGKRNAMGDDLR
jgi:hypothetical protein